MSYDDWKLASPEDYADPNNGPCEHCVHWERETDIFYCCECGAEGANTMDEADSWVWRAGMRGEDA